MIDKQKLTAVIEDAIAGSEVFLVDVKISADNSIVVEIDSDNSLDINTCATITRKIEDAFDRDVEDFELEVGSAGLTSPFKVKRQYIKNIGNPVEVVTRDGRKFTGTLVEVNDNDFTVEVPTKVKHEGAKRPVIEQVPENVTFDNAKSVKYHFEFK